MTQGAASPAPAVPRPGPDFSTIPYQVFTDPRLFELEQARGFQGPTWSFLGFECELPKPGDYLTGYVGTAPYVLTRDQNGTLRAFVNRCAHRGAEVVRRLRGNARDFTCIYHNWCYGLDGALVGVPLERGRDGKGGFPEWFRKEDHGVRRLRVETLAGIVFGSFSDAAPPLEDYIGPAISQRLRDIRGNRDFRVTGYHRHTIRANWKQLFENSRDVYHAPQLHGFFGAFGIVRPDNRGYLDMDTDGLNCLITIFQNSDRERVTLEDPRVASSRTAMSDAMNVTIVGIFPGTMFTLAGSSFSARQLRPKAPGLFEAVYTYFTYADDEALLKDHLLQNNQFGPAGLVAMEDAEVLEKSYARIASGPDSAQGIIAMGEGGPDDRRVEHLLTETNIRAFWKGYWRVMGLEGPR